MIVSSCFHANRIVPQYKYSDEYLNFIIKMIVYKSKAISEQGILEQLSKKYNPGQLKNSSLRERFHEILGEKEKGKYNLNDDIMIYFQDFELLKKGINDTYNCSQDFLFERLSLKAETGEQSMALVTLYTVLYSKMNNYNESDTIIYIYNYYKNFEKNINRLYDAVNAVKKNYFSLYIYDVFQMDELEKKIMIKENINTLEDFCNINIYALMFLVSAHFDDFILRLEPLSISIRKVISDSFSMIDEKNLDILYKRNGYIDNTKYTLEEIGSSLNVTRERIRQLEAKTIGKIKTIASEKSNVLSSLYNSELGKRKPYVTLDKIASKYDSEFINKIMLLFEYGENDIVYDSKYQILYDKTTNDITSMINDEINKIGNIAEPSEIEKSDLFAMNVVKYNYRMVGENLYIKDGCAYRELFLELIEQLFPKGFHINDENDYNSLINTAKERYNINDNLPSKHSLEAMLERGDCIQIDRGTYISSKYMVSLEPELVDKMLNYISKNEFTYYNAIFDEFENELKKIGIRNRYYLKGCLDTYLPDDMITKRDYIVCGNTNITPYEVIINKLRSFPGKFTKDEIKNIFAGIKEYTIYNYLYNEIENGLIWISMNEFIYADNYEIDDSTKNELKEYIEFLFKTIDTKLLTSKKIYAKMQFTNKQLFEKLKLSNGHFELFSIIKALFKEYYYSRPFICLDEEGYNSRSTIVQNYVRKFDSFNYKKIQEYLSKLNLGVLYSYLAFMEDMSDEYVQVDLDEMVRIDKMNLSESKVGEIKKSIDLILDNFDIIETSKFNGYSLLPKISYVWNKYLLVGIIRSYLSEFYDIKNTNNKYTNTDFEIRRVQYE